MMVMMVMVMVLVMVVVMVMGDDDEDGVVVLWIQISSNQPYMSERCTDVSLYATLSVAG